MDRRRRPPPPDALLFGLLAELHLSAGDVAAARQRLEQAGQAASATGERLHDGRIADLAEACGHG